MPSCCNSIDLLNNGSSCCGTFKGSVEPAASDGGALAGEGKGTFVLPGAALSTTGLSDPADVDASSEVLSDLLTAMRGKDVVDDS